MNESCRLLALAVALSVAAGCSFQRTNAPDLNGGATIAAGENCAVPPVKAAADAICLANRYAKRLAPIELIFETKEQPNTWIVSFQPKDPSTFGGAGDLEIDKVSGKITVLALYR